MHYASGHIPTFSTVILRRRDLQNGALSDIECRARSLINLKYYDRVTQWHQATRRVLNLQRPEESTSSEGVLSLKE